MNARQLLAVLGLTVGISCPAVASLVEFDLSLTLNAVSNTPDCGNSFPPHIFGCLSEGETFNGHFSVDSAILGTDGASNTAAIYDFYLPFGRLIYSTGSDNTDLVGWRNVNGLGAVAPGFIVEHGQVVDLEGDVYGYSDAPFIDWYSGGSLGVQRNSFYALDLVGDSASGSLTVTRHLPEPGTLGLVLLGLAVPALITRRSQDRLKRPPRRVRR
jgi:hypothetical protein